MGTYLSHLGPAAEIKEPPNHPLRLHSGGSKTHSLVNLMQTSSTILEGLLGQLQMTKGQRH